MKLLAIAAIAVSAHAQIQYDKIEFITEQYTPNLYMVAGAPGDADPNHPDGAGGRIGILTGPDGIFMVDSQYEQVTAKVLAALPNYDLFCTENISENLSISCKRRKAVC